MGLTSVRQLLGYVAGGVMLVFGLMVVTGVMAPKFISSGSFTIIFGAVLILFGVFRILSVYFGANRQRKSIIEDDSWKGGGSERSAGSSG